MHPVSFCGFNDLGILFLPKGIRKCDCSSVHNNVMIRVENVTVHYVKSIAHRAKLLRRYYTLYYVMDFPVALPTTMARQFLQKYMYVYLYIY